MIPGVRNYTETETEKERTVSYDTERAHITVHIPKRTPEEQAEYEKNIRAAMRQLYHHITVEKGLDLDEIVKKHTEGATT